MNGLYKSTVVNEVETIKRLLKFNPKFLRIYPVYVIEDSELYAMYKNSVYKPLSINEAVSRCSKVIEECAKTDVAIIRLGLQSTEDITIANSNIFGPVSDNLAEYVMAEIVRKKIDKILIDKSIKEYKIIYVKKHFVSICIVPNKINKIYFEQKYNVKYIVKGEI